MDNWLGKVSRHPTGSAIIGGVVVLAVGAAVTKWWDNIVGALGSVWCCPAAIAHRVGGWFSYKVPVPRYALIGGLLLIIGLTYIGCAYLVRSAIKASLRSEEHTS